MLTTLAGSLVEVNEFHEAYSEIYLRYRSAFFTWLREGTQETKEEAHRAHAVFAQLLLSDKSFYSRLRGTDGVREFLVPHAMQVGDTLFAPRYVNSVSFVPQPVSLGAAMAGVPLVFGLVGSYGSDWPYELL